jgi:hypothetical protein
MYGSWPLYTTTLEGGLDAAWPELARGRHS